MEALGQNTTLKVLKIRACNPTLFVTAYASAQAGKDIVAILKKNYGLENTANLSCSNACNLPVWLKEATENIARLNKAGRRYLLTDPSDRSKGIHVLSEVSDSLDCLFLHLQENPSLCDEYLLQRQL